jgi:hypothetical protein
MGRAEPLEPLLPDRCSCGDDLGRLSTERPLPLDDLATELLKVQADAVDVSIDSAEALRRQRDLVAGCVAEQVDLLRIKTSEYLLKHDKSRVKFAELLTEVPELPSRHCRPGYNDCFPWCPQLPLDGPEQEVECIDDLSNEHREQQIAPAPLLGCGIPGSCPVHHHGVARLDDDDEVSADDNVNALPGNAVTINLMWDIQADVQVTGVLDDAGCYPHILQVPNQGFIQAEPALELPHFRIR